jgi:hypothetical protein
MVKSEQFKEYKSERVRWSTPPPQRATARYDAEMR